MRNISIKLYRIYVFYTNNALYHVIYSVRYYPRFRVTAVGLGTYYPWIRGPPVISSLWIGLPVLSRCRINWSTACVKYYVGFLGLEIHALQSIVFVHMSFSVVMDEARWLVPIQYSETENFSVKLLRRDPSPQLPRMAYGLGQLRFL